MTLIILGLFVLGLCFGSFVSVILTRLGDEISWKQLKGILFGFSHCPKCKKRLHAKNMVPVLSFLFQKGKCSFCKKKIDRIYPVLEIGSAIVFVVSFLAVKYLIPDLQGSELIWNSVFWIVVNWLLFSILIYDIKEKYLHVPLRFLTILFVLSSQLIGNIGDYRMAFGASILFGGFFYLIYRGAKLYMKQKYGKKTEGIGEGDAMLAFLIGTLVPFIFIYHGIKYGTIQLVETFLVFMILSGIIGLIWAGIEILGKKIYNKKIKGPIKLQTIAFLPSMIISFWILLLSGKYFIFMVFSATW